jgi:hypothetical protein
MPHKKPTVLVVGKTSVIAMATKQIPESVTCSKLWLAGSVLEGLDYLERGCRPDVVMTTIHPPWQTNLGHFISRQSSDLNSIVLASHALGCGVPLVVAVNDSDQPHLLAEIVLETMAHFVQQNRNAVVFLSGKEYHMGRHGIDWAKVLDDGIHGGTRWSPRTIRKPSPPK